MVAVLVASHGALWAWAAVAGFVLFTGLAEWTVVNRDSRPAPPEPYTYVYDPAWAKEPWRYTHPGAAAIPARALWMIAEPAELAKAGLEPDRLDQLRVSYAKVGPQLPLTVVLDGRGRCCIEDGHHRLLIAEAAGVPVLPVNFKRVSAIRGWSRPMTDLLVHALDAELVLA